MTALAGHPAPRLAVAIPARNEEALLGRCLDALARQQDAPAFTVVVLANNCTDATVAVAGQPRGLDVRVVEAHFPPAEQTAGHARRAALAAAAEGAELVLTTDADCVADPDWVAAHHAAFARGVDAVAGRVSGDWEELRHQPPEFLAIGAAEWEYLGLIAEAEAVFDPRPHDPAPRHAQCCGANLGITRAMLERVGGVPPLPTGEDRALIAAVERAGGLVRHDRAPHVVASARLAGRAAGGMAAALAARRAPDYRCDEQFLPADTLVAHWQARRAHRHATRGGDAGPSADRATLPSAYLAPPLGPRLRPTELPAEMARLRARMAGHG